MLEAKNYLKENSKIFESQIGYYNFYYPDKDKKHLSNIKKEIKIMHTWISPSGLVPFYFLSQDIKVIYWTEKENIQKVEK